MILIDKNTRISTLLSGHPGALEAIISINSKFEKLRNPLLRKLMAGRTSLAMAARVGGCHVNDFFNVLESLGFRAKPEPAETPEENPFPDFLKTIQDSLIRNLDVRPLIAAEKDPLKIIIKEIQSMDPHGTVKIINSFEPTPLIHLLKKQGYGIYVEKKNKELYITWIYNLSNQKTTTPIQKISTVSAEWEDLLDMYDGRMTEVDVRHMNAPAPMVTILELLEDLPDDMALFVFHKKLPVYLLPELEEKGYSYSYKDNGPNDLHLLIYK